MKKIMYLGLGTAMPSDKNLDYIQEVNYAVLVFVTANSFEDANKRATEHLESTGWENVVMDKMNPVDGSAISEAQPEVKAAYELAVKDGSHAMILDRGVKVS